MKPIRVAVARIHANVTFRPTQGRLSGHVVPGVALDYSFAS